MPQLGTETKVYRFYWSRGFDGDAVIRVGRQDDGITLRAAYDPADFSDDIQRQLPITMSDWGSITNCVERCRLFGMWTRMR